MKTIIKNSSLIKILSIIIISILFFGFSQLTDKNLKIDKKNSKFLVKGTSTLHDWKVDVTKVDGELSVQIDEKNNIVNFNSVNINCTSNSLLSGESGMDKKTFEALKTDKFPVINFKSTDIKKGSVVNGKQQFIANGKMTICGISRAVQIIAVESVAGSGIYCFEGSEEISMTDYGIVPPTAVFGTIKSGNKVTAVFKANFSLL